MDGNSIYLQIWLGWGASGVCRSVSCHSSPLHVAALPAAMCSSSRTMRLSIGVRRAA